MSDIPNDWPFVRMDAIAHINPPRKVVVTQNQNITFLAMEDVSNSAQVIGGKIRPYGEVSSGYTSFSENDILIAKITPCFENGKGAHVQKLENQIGFGSTEFHVLRAGPKVHDRFLFYLTTGHKFRRRGQENMQGSAGQRRVPTDFVKSYRFPLPPLPEQRKIAQILGTWDEAIASTEKLIATLERRKRGLMQRLLTGQVRFPGFVDAWKVMQLGEFLRYTPRKVKKPTTAYNRMGIRSHGKGTFTGMVEDPNSNAMDYLYVVKADDLIVNITFAWEQAIAIVAPEDEDALVSHRFPTYTFRRNRVISEFFRYLMLTKRFLYQLDLITPGGAGRNRVMSKTDFLKLTVKVPSIAEQTLIGEALGSVDQNIKSRQLYLAALREQKKGLMQRLLTGQVRVAG